MTRSTRWLITLPIILLILVLGTPSTLELLHGLVHPATVDISPRFQDYEWPNGPLPPTHFFQPLPAIIAIALTASLFRLWGRQYP